MRYAAPISDSRSIEVCKYKRIWSKFSSNISFSPSLPSSLPLVLRVKFVPQAWDVAPKIFFLISISLLEMQPISIFLLRKKLTTQSGFCRRYVIILAVQGLALSLFSFTNLSFLFSISCSNMNSLRWVQVHLALIEFSDNWLALFFFNFMDEISTVGCECKFTLHWT